MTKPSRSDKTPEIDGGTILVVAYAGLLLLSFVVLAIGRFLDWIGWTPILVVVFSLVAASHVWAFFSDRKKKAARELQKASHRDDEATR